MTQAIKDNNSVASLIGVSSATTGAFVAGVTPVPAAVDPITGRMLVDLAGNGNLTIGSSTITGGTTGLLLYDNAGVVGELALATYPSLTELSYVKGVTSGIQAQINAKGTGTVTGTGTTNEIAYWASSSGLGTLAVATYPSLTELSYVKGVTSGIQSQLNGKQASGSYITASSTDTLTNKRITPRILSAASYTTNTGTSIASDTQDMFIVTAQAGDLLFNNPTGTPTDGQKLIISVASSTTSARALTWGNGYGATTVALPTTTTATTATLTMGFIWSASKSLWQCVAVS